MASAAKKNIAVELQRCDGRRGCERAWTEALVLAEARMRWREEMEGSCR